MDPAVYDAYAGEYELRPGFSLAVTREGDRIFAQATGQPKIEIFPESETRFFLKAVDAQIDFVRGADGQVTGLVLHQNGRDLPGRGSRGPPATTTGAGTGITSAATGGNLAAPVRGNLLRVRF